MGSWGLIEKGVILLLAFSALMAMITSTPLLQNKSLGVNHRIFPARLEESNAVFDMPHDLGNLRIEPDSQYGCILLRKGNGQIIRRVCNQSLMCRDNATTASASLSFEVFRLPQSNVFYVETGSQCNSTCCDWRGMTFTGDGDRLDDDLFQRITLRLGGLGIFMFLFGVICFTWVLRTPRPLLARIGMIFGFGIVTIMLWWNL